MKTQQKQKVNKAVMLGLLISVANVTIAQSSVNTISTNENPPEKIFVQLKVIPQTKSFMANVSETDSSMKFKVWFANPEEAKVSISIKSAAGGYFFSKRLSDAWYAQNYDFSNVEDGIYTIEIAKGRECIRKNILISTDIYTMRRTRVY